MMKLISKITLLFLFITILFSLPLGSIYAEGVEQLELPKTIVNPGSFYYSLKRLWEKGMERIQFNEQSKINYNQKLLKIRLAELIYVVDNKFLSELQISSERFSYYAGVLTNELIKQENIENKQKIIGEFEKYGKSLEKLRNVYPANSSYWMLVQHDINTLSILTERLK